MGGDAERPHLWSLSNKYIMDVNWYSWIFMGYQCINVDINGILVGIVGIIYICIHIYVFMGYFHVILPSCNHLDVKNPLFVDHVPKENHCGFFGSTTIGLVRKSSS